MKKTGIVVAAILIVAVLVGGFYFTVKRSRVPSKSQQQALTEVEKINTKDLERDYPSTPREVVKFYNRIITAYYFEKISDEELKKMTSQAYVLFDAQLQDNNPSEIYLQSVKAEIAEYKSASKTISHADVCDSNDVRYLTDGNDKIAYVKASYFMKEGSDFSRTHEMYILRKDADGFWRILGYYQIEAADNASGNE
ncbi:MAG: hypothetical protein K6G13_04650 [Agathobacter sp.]|uniref:DUF6715 family protein n=1 Tax=Agathobacter sp. TaxID=2021311 RepID=UPI00258DE551|nr:DUF6715 family protein [Agathobacter sp.]MCR5677303.1 hypothetical protein [Agathobacter sp.]